MRPLVKIFRLIMVRVIATRAVRTVILLMMMMMMLMRMREGDTARREGEGEKGGE